MMADEMLTMDETRKALGVSVARIRFFIEEGRLKPEKRAGRLFFRAADIDQFTRRPAGRPRKQEETR